VEKLTKQQYVTPTLKEHGVVRELTQTGSGNSGPDRNKHRGRGWGWGLFKKWRKKRRR